MAKRKLDLENDYLNFSKQAKAVDNTILSEDTVQYDFMTSLLNITMAKIITKLWMNQSEELMKLSGYDACRSNINENTWLKIEKNAVDQLLELRLPDPLAKRLATVVPLIGHTLFDWIRYHDQFIFKSDGYSAVHQISHIAWTARGRIDYAQTAKNILANRFSTLNDEHKYKLACTFCLENEIHVYASNVVNKDFIDDINIVFHTMVCFWTAKLTGDNRILQQLPYLFRVYSKSIKGRLFRFLLGNDGTGVNRNCNAVAIRHMWNELNEKEKAENITIAVKILGREDLRYSLLSSLDFEQQQKVFKECSSVILSDIFNDWLWGEYFVPTAIHTLKVIDPLPFLDILNMIVKEINKNFEEGNEYLYDRYKSIFAQLWLNCRKNLKEYIFGHMDGYLLQRLVTSSICSERDVNLISLIHKDLDSQQKKNVILGNKVFGRCTVIIRKGRWDLLKLFIEYTNLSDEDYEYDDFEYDDDDDDDYDYDYDLDRRLLKDRGDRIAFYFFVQESQDKIEHFLSWAFQSKEEIDEFKRSLANFDTLLESIIVNDNADFSKSKIHAKQFTNSYLEEMSRFKAEFPTSISGYCLIEQLLKEDKYELLDKVLNWCFCNDQQQIMRFRKNIYKNEPIMVHEFMPINKINLIKILDKFIDWSFTNEQELRF